MPILLLSPRSHNVFHLVRYITFLHFEYLQFVEVSVNIRARRMDLKFGASDMSEVNHAVFTT